MAVQILSDLHLEAPKDVFKIVPKAPYLAMLGDVDASLGEFVRDDFPVLRVSSTSKSARRSAVSLFTETCSNISQLTSAAL